MTLAPKTPEAVARSVRVYEAVGRAGQADRELLAEMTGLAPVTVWRHLRALHDDGLVERSERYAVGGYRWSQATIPDVVTCDPAAGA